MKKIIAFAFALMAVAVVQAASVSWSISDATVKGYNYEVVDPSVITALQSGKVYDDESAFNAAISAKTTYSDDNIGSALTATGTVNGKGKASGSVDGAGDSVTFIFWSGTPADGGSFLYGTFSTSGYIYEKPNAAPATLAITGLSTGTFKTSSLTVVPEPCTVALLAIGLAAFGLKRKVA